MRRKMNEFEKDKIIEERAKVFYQNEILYDRRRGHNKIKQG